MTVQERIAELRRVVQEARSMPMSASAVVNRAELLAMLDELAATARAELAEAADVVSAKDDVVREGQRQSDELVARARENQDVLASESEVLQRARAQADAELTAAREQAEVLRREIDDYVDTKLAGFEVALQRSLETVRRGRERLASGDGTGPTGLGAVPDPPDDVELPRHLQG